MNNKYVKDLDIGSTYWYHKFPLLTFEMNPIFQSIIFKFVLYVIVEFVRSYENERSFHCLWLYYFHIILQEHTCPITKSTNYQISLQTLLECFNHRSTHNVHLYVIIMLQTIIIPLLKASCFFFLNLSDWIISYQYEYFVYPSCTYCCWF